jgi:hypothetical protein
MFVAFMGKICIDSTQRSFSCATLRACRRWRMNERRRLSIMHHAWGACVLARAGGVGVGCNQRKGRHFAASVGVSCSHRCQAGCTSQANNCLPRPAVTLTCAMIALAGQWCLSYVGPMSTSGLWLCGKLHVQCTKPAYACP